MSGNSLSSAEAFPLDLVPTEVMRRKKVFFRAGAAGAAAVAAIAVPLQVVPAVPVCDGSVKN